jgi:hypothetical protein
MEHILFNELLKSLNDIIETHDRIETAAASRTNGPDHLNVPDAIVFFFYDFSRFIVCHFFSWSKLRLNS